MADTKNETGVVVLGVTAGILAITSGFFGYKTWTMNKSIRELHDNINKAAAGSVPASLIPQSMMDIMNKMK